VLKVQKVIRVIKVSQVQLDRSDLKVQQDKTALKVRPVNKDQ
jgi:hypothetical protein